MLCISILVYKLISFKNLTKKLWRCDMECLMNIGSIYVAIDEKPTHQSLNMGCLHTFLPSLCYYKKTELCRGIHPLVFVTNPNFLSLQPKIVTFLDMQSHDCELQKKKSKIIINGWLICFRLKSSMSARDVGAHVFTIGIFREGSKPPPPPFFFKDKYTDKNVF